MARAADVDPLELKLEVELEKSTREQNVIMLRAINHFSRFATSLAAAGC